MKALTLNQPYASLFVLGIKHHETRSWRTDYRGPLAIHAALGLPGWARRALIEVPAIRAAFFPALGPRAYPTMGEWRSVIQALPRGVVVATATLVNVVPVTVAPHLTETECQVGDYTPGRFAWLLQDVCVLEQPAVARGNRRLWDWEPSLAQAAR